MPLLSGKSKHIVSANISELMKSGRGRDQSIAIALKHAGKAKKLKGVTKKVAAKRRADRVEVKKGY